MNKWIFMIALLMIYIGGVGAQSYMPLNSVYYSSPHLAFFNPAPLVLIGNSHGFVGINLLHLGLAGDQLRNNALSLVQPIGVKTALGLRAQYFTSNIFQKGNFGLLLSQKLYQDVLTLGINANLLTHSFNQDNFVLFDSHDPVIRNGTSHIAFSYGLGLWLRPLPGLTIGLAADHLNQPDVSLDQSSVLQPRIYQLGLALTSFPVIPQIEIQKEGDALWVQGSLRTTVLQKKLDLLAGYTQYENSGGSVFAQFELKFGDLGILYSYQNPLTEGIAALTGGSHQIGVFYTRRSLPSAPEVSLPDLPSIWTRPEIELKGKALNADGLTTLEVKNNGKPVGKPKNLNNAKSVDILEKIPLEPGRNIIQVSAFAGPVSRSEKVFVMFEPEPPKIRIDSEKNTQTRDRSYHLKLSVSDPIGLDTLRVVHNDQEIIHMAQFQDKNSITLDKVLALFEGQNSFQISVSNPWQTSRDSLWLFYQSQVPPPRITIDSPDRPISDKSQITIDLKLENPDSIRQVLIKVNGQTVDTIQVYRTRIFGEIRPAQYDSLRTLEIRAAKNLVEAIALDRNGLPRTSQTMDIFYNPCAKELRYPKKRAIVIGIDDYQAADITDLDQAVADARLIADLLKKDFKFDRVDLMVNNQATFEAMYARFSDSLLNARPDEFILIYYAGHGDQITGPTGEDFGFILPHDASLTSVSKRITMNFLKDYLIQSPAADILCIMDACYSGLGIVTRPPLSYEEQKREINYDWLCTEAKKPTRAVISAGGKKEQAVDGLFTRILRQGLLGAADRNGDAYLSSVELGLYVSKHVSEEARSRYGREQRPQFGSLISDPGECVFEVKQ